MRRPSTVLIGFLGTTLDAHSGPDRWGVWRPTVSACRHDALPLKRLELLHEPRFGDLADRIARDIERVSPGTCVRKVTVDLSDPWDFAVVYAALLEFAEEYPFDLENEDYLVHITTGTHVIQSCLFTLCASRFMPARLLQTIPPSSGQGPAGSFRCIDLEQARYEAISSRIRRKTREDLAFLKAGIETRNADFNRLIEGIERVCVRSSAPIVLLGPTGAGKTLLARRIYELKRKHGHLSGPLVEVNCSTLRGDAAQSALFGHVKGAYTGAARDRDGLLRAADGGLLFLDEVADLGPDEQAMLLRALEEKRFLPLGADHEVESDFHLICATHRDLPARVRDGQFREDLLARIGLWTFRLPGLRERPEDIEPNLAYELEAFAERTGERVRFEPGARERFLDFAISPGAAWRANFRDLNGAVVRMATLAVEGLITASNVAKEIERLRESWKDHSNQGPRFDQLVALIGEQRVEEMDLFDRVQLAEVIRVCRSSSSLSEAGRTLFAVSRREKSSTNDADRLRKYLKRHDLSFDEIASFEVT